MKKRILAISFLIIILVISTFLLVVFSSSYQLKKIGYENYQFLVSNLDRQEIAIVIKFDYNDKLLSIISSLEYRKEKLNDYLNYAKDNKEVNGSLIVTLVNNGIDKLKTSYNPLIVKLIKDKSYSLFRIQYKNKNATKSLGYKFRSSLPFRDYETRRSIYNRYLKSYRLEYTLKSSAKPGFSEHQTGLAMDLNNSGSMYDFDKTKDREWLQKNAKFYGFILRYPKGKESITGYKYEPWHYRYVGIEAATYIYENNLTFDEYYAYFIEYN